MAAVEKPMRTEHAERLFLLIMGLVGDEKKASWPYHFPIGPAYREPVNCSVHLPPSITSTRDILNDVLREQHYRSRNAGEEFIKLSVPRDVRDHILSGKHPSIDDCVNSFVADLGKALAFPKEGGKI